MNWYKLATIDNFVDRNRANEKIKDMEVIHEGLLRLSKLVFQTGINSRNMLRQIMAGKRLSSYPKIEELLQTADKVCLDSPHRFSVICKAAAQQVELRLKKLVKERKEFAFGLNPTKERKGWRMDD